MTTRTKLSQFLKEYLQPELFKDYCPNGLQIEGKDKIKKIVTAVSANLETIKKAVEAKADALICHHGIFWKGDSYRIEGSKKEQIELLLKNQISLFGYHLPLDAHAEVGNNFKAAQELGVTDLEPFGDFGGVKIGVKGRVKPRAIELFVAELEAYYDHRAHVALGGKKEISSVALISGGAYRSIAEAAQEGVDCFITGNFDEPAWAMAHEKKINFMALGHSATEKIGPKALAQYLQAQLGTEALFLDIYNPF